MVGVIVALGGQTPLKLARALPPDLVLGTSPASIDLAEDRERWNRLCGGLGIPQPPGGTASSVEEALAVARRVGYPVLVRPSYVLGGRAMEIVYDDADLRRVMAALARGLAREGGVTAERPVLVDRFLEDAVEVDVDAVRDRAGEVLVCGVMEHVEEAGVHSGDSACALPPQTLPAEVLDALDRHTRALAEALEVRGLLNVQYAVKDGNVYVLEANPRASRTVPFVAKATGVPVAMVAARVMVGDTLEALRAEGLVPADAVGRVPDPPLREREGGGAALRPLPRGRHAARARDALHRRGDGGGRHLRAGLRQEPDGRRHPPARRRARSSCPWRTGTSRPGWRWRASFAGLGFSLAATLGTAGYLRDHGVEVDTLVAKVGEEGLAADAVELIAGGQGAAGGEHAPRAGAPGPTAPTSGPPPSPTTCPA